jgi:adenylylsulfate kinase
MSRSLVRTIGYNPSVAANWEHGMVVWLTGLSGAGKTELARALATAVRRAGGRAEVLDGDEVRSHLSGELGFSREDRDRNVKRIAYVAQLLARNDVVAIVAAISPYRDGRQLARRAASRFVEVYVSTPIEECIRRDPKGLYARALAGGIPRFTGVSDPYEAPEQAEIEVDTSHTDVATAIDRILAVMQRSTRA